MAKLLKTGLRLAAAAAIPVAIVAATWEGLKVRKYEIRSEKVTEAVRLIHLSDLHGVFHGEEQKKLVKLIKKQSPAAILMSGDMLDDEGASEGTLCLLEQIAKDYPCFYVPGNHEHRTGNIEGIKRLFRSYGVFALGGDTETVLLAGQRFSICGADETTEDKAFRRQLLRLNAEKKDGSFAILLSHRPEKYKYYNMCSFDLVLCGHAHGGQVRIPRLLNGLYAPGQGLFPKYAGGMYELDSGKMIVSRGLALSRIPRVFNPPEVVVIDLLPTEKVETEAVADEIVDMK